MKASWEKKKMLATNILSFSKNDYYTITDIYFSKYFEFGKVQNLVLW